MKKYMLIAFLDYGTLEQTFDNIYDAFDKITDLKKNGIVVKGYSLDPIAV